MMVLPTLVLVLLTRTDNLSGVPIVVGAGVLGSLAMALRVLLVVRLRDWSYERERDIRAFGERLVQARDTDAAVATAVETMAELTESKALVGILELGDDGTDACCPPAGNSQVHQIPRQQICRDPETLEASITPTCQSRWP